MPAISNRTLAKAIAVFGGAQAFSVLAALLRTKVAAHTIGAAGVGLVAMYYTLSMLLSNLMGCGLSSSSVPALSQAKGDERRMIVIRLRTMAGVLALLAVPVSLVVASFYSAEAMWITLAVVATILAGIETAVLKGLQSTRRLTLSIIAAAVCSVVFTVPFYYWLGISGAIWAVVGTAIATAVFTCYLGWQAFPAGPDFSLLRQGLFSSMRPMLILGLSFFVSGVLSQGVDLFSQTWLQTVADRSTVGLYKAGYQLAITYTGLVFAAIGNDFYPRLSSIVHDVDQRHQLIRQQIRVLLCLVTPLILLFEVFVPWIIPLLFSDEFLPVIPMVRWASVVIILKCIYMPMAYLPIALGRSAHFLLLEVVSWLMVAVGVVVGYSFSGLEGIGVGLVITNVFDMLFVWLFCRHYYGFKR